MPPSSWHASHPPKGCLVLVRVIDVSGVGCEIWDQGCCCRQLAPSPRFPALGSVFSHAVPVYCLSEPASGQAFFNAIPGMAHVDLLGSSLVRDVCVPTTAVQLIATVTGRSDIAISAVLGEQRYTDRSSIRVTAVNWLYQYTDSSRILRAPVL